MQIKMNPKEKYTNNTYTFKYYCFPWISWIKLLHLRPYKNFVFPGACNTQESALHADNADEKKVVEEVSGEAEHVTMREEMRSLLQKPPLTPVTSV